MKTLPIYEKPFQFHCFNDDNINNVILDLDENKSNLNAYIPTGILKE